MFIAEDFSHFKTQFVNKLRNMLSDDELGAFILVLANSRQDAFLKNALEDDLKSVFAVLKEKYRSGKLNATQDDSDVFQQLLDIALQDIPLWQCRTAGDWEVAYNPMRKLRPARASTQVLSSIRQDFDETKFHFNKPFLKPEMLWQGDYQNFHMSVLYNKFPFSDYHLLITISPEKNFSQVLTQDLHKIAFSMVNEVARLFPGFGVGFNSLAAGASVNHLHFQGFIREQEFPLEKNRWRHNGGNADYPLTVNKFTEVVASWAYIEQLIEQNKAFNCLYRNNCCYVIPRKFQGTVALPGWLSGAGWLDAAGVVTESEREVFDNLTADEIFQGLRLLR